MKRRMIPVLSACLMAAILFFSCTAPFDIRTRDSKPVIVIYGCLTNEYMNQYIRITRSAPYFEDAESQIVENAKVKVVSSVGREYTFLRDVKGYYVSQRRFAVVQGVTYHLSVEIDDDLYEAETTTLPVVPVDSISVKMINIMGYNHYSLQIYMQEPPETENYYLFKYIINDSITNDRISELIMSNDLAFNGEYIYGANITYFEDATNSRSQDRNKENEHRTYVSQGDYVRLQVLNIEKGYYYFIRDCMREKYGENPFFGGPPSNIQTNLSNGAVGYFTSYCIHENTTVVPASSQSLRAGQNR